MKLLTQTLALELCADDDDSEMCTLSTMNFIKIVQCGTNARPVVYGLLEIVRKYFTPKRTMTMGSTNLRFG